MIDSITRGTFARTVVRGLWRLYVGIACHVARECKGQADMICFKCPCVQNLFVSRRNVKGPNQRDICHV